MTSTLDTGATNGVLQDLDRRKRQWARLPIPEKVEYLREVRRLTVEHASDWVEAGAALKGFAPDSPLAFGEEWVAGPILLARYLTDLIDSLTILHRGEDLLAGIAVRTRPDGQVIARVAPHDVHDRLWQLRADVWMQPGVSAKGLADSLASFYRQSDPPGRVTLVLGAGNNAFLTPADMLSALVVDGDVVVVKMNPVNEVYGPVLERIFEPMIADGYVRFLYGGADAGAALVRDERVERVHVTGSVATYDAIVWGTGPEAVQRRERGEPLLDKPVTAELGGVGPTVVVPGRWSSADIALQARVVATQKLFGSGHICVASQVLVLPAAWPQAEEFLDSVRAELTAAPDRDAFYPGTQETIDGFLTDHPQAELLDSRQPRVLLAGVDHAADHRGFREELFGPIHLSTSLPGRTPQEYFATAVEFVNERLSGNLSANLIIDPTVARSLGTGLEDRIAGLRAGNIGVNAPTMLLAGVGRVPWGAFPGNHPRDIGSGVGFVHNALMFPQPQKNVGWGAFRPTPPLVRRGRYLDALTPFWLVDKEFTVPQARALLDHAADPRPRTLVGVLRRLLLP